MIKLFQRYQAIFKSQEFVITVTTGILILLSIILKFSNTNYWLYTGTAILAVVFGALPIIFSAIKGLLKRQVNVDELVVIAIIASVVYREYLSAAFVAFMMLFGKILENFTAERARTTLQDLGKLTPQKVYIWRNGKEMLVLLNEVVIGDIVICHSGERIPIDGVIIKGNASVNQSPITGESIPVSKSIGSVVYAGSFNELGTLEIGTVKVGEDTTIGQVIKLVTQTKENRAPIVRTADKYAKYFTFVILIVAGMVFLITRQLNNVIAVLIVACPCALVMATPIAVIAGVANGARRGILIKGGARLEAAGKITAVAFDKTGTMTLGNPQIVKIIPLNNLTEKEILRLAVIAEKSSEHIIGKALVNQALSMNLEIPTAEDVQIMPGLGVLAKQNGKVIIVGTEALCKQHNISCSPTIKEQVSSLGVEGFTPLLVALSGKMVGIICLTDTVRKEMSNAIFHLKENGVKKVVMLTGDSPEVARRIAKSVGIEEYYARLLPEQKVEHIKKLQQAGYKVAMVGDGINDAPALTQADVGIAMGITGSDLTMDAADIVLMRDDVLLALDSIYLSRKTLGIIKQNLAFALIFNLIGIIAASFGLLIPIWAAIFHNFGSVAVVINSARLATHQYSRKREKN